MTKKTSYDIAVERLIAETDMDALRRDMANARALITAGDDLEDMAINLHYHSRKTPEIVALYAAAAACRDRARRQIEAAPALLVTSWGEVVL